MEQSTSLKKYEELYSLCKQGLDEEAARFRRLDEKASRYFTVLSFLLVLSGLAGRFAFGLTVPPSGLMDWICLSAGVGFTLSIFVALLFVFSVLRTQDLTVLPISKELVSFFDDHDYLDVIYALTRGIVDAVAENRAVSYRKTQKLTWGYRFILLSIFFVAVFGVSLFARGWKSGP